MRPILFSLLTATTLISLFGCKKNKNTAVPKVDTPFVYGYLSALRQAEQLSSGDTFTYIESGEAYFLNDSISKAKLTFSYNVALNEDTLGFPPGLPTGTDAVVYAGPSFFSNGVNWSVQGFASIPSLSFSAPGAFPNYTGNLPDTIVVANGTTIQFNATNLTNADSITVVITSLGNQSQYHNARSPLNGDLIITPAELNASFSSDIARNNNLMSLYVYIRKFDFETVDGKLFKFIREYWISKPLYLH